MKTVRQKIFEFIRTHQLVTVAQISRGLHMTPANARHHLAILVNQELIQIVGKRPAAHRGRPPAVYSLSRHTLGENADRLVDALLTELERRVAPPDLDRLYQNVALSMVGEEVRSGEVKPVGSYYPSITKRIREAVQLLNTWHYHARWEAHKEAPYIILGHCPYLSFLPAHPELCEIDRHIIETLLDTPVDQLSKRAPDERGIPSCHFRLRSQP